MTLRGDFLCPWLWRPFRRYAVYSFDLNFRDRSICFLQNDRKIPIYKYMELFFYISYTFHFGDGCLLFLNIARWSFPFVWTNLDRQVTYIIVYMGRTLMHCSSKKRSQPTLEKCFPYNLSSWWTRELDPIDSNSNTTDRYNADWCGFRSDFWTNTKD